MQAIPTAKADTWKRCRLASAEPQNLWKPRRKHNFCSMGPVYYKKHKQKHLKSHLSACFYWCFLVGGAGFEPATPAV